MIGSTEWACDRMEEMEELVLGNLSVARARDAERHRASCASCNEAHAQFAEERALFTQRASVIIAPPPPSTGAVSFVRRNLWSTTRVVAAAFACAAAIVCVVRDASTTATDVAAPEPPALRATVDEGLACAYPASGFSPGARASLSPAPRSYGASHDIGVCEERPAISSGP